MYMNEAMNILVENAKTLAERKEIFSLTEAESANVNNTLITKLFNSAIKKSHVDFDDIPMSKGDITKYSGYKSMVESIELVRKISINAGHKLKELDIVDKALGNIVTYRDMFERGFKLDKDFVILQYNTLVSACVVSVSSIISSYVDYVRKVDKVEFEIVNTKAYDGNICINSLDRFNKSVSKGEFSKVMSAAVKVDVDKFTGAEVVAISVLIIAGTVALVTIMRELVFFFYHSRMKLADYLELQAMFLELNKNNIMANGSGIPAAKRNDIIKKQQKIIDKLHKAADKVKVNAVTATKEMNSDLKKENSSWRFEEVKSESVKTDPNGFQLI